MLQNNGNLYTVTIIFDEASVATYGAGSIPAIIRVVHELTEFGKSDSFDSKKL